MTKQGRCNQLEFKQLKPSNNPWKQVIPTRVLCFYQGNLPATSPLLQTLLTLNGFGHAGVKFIPDQSRDTVLFGEAFNRSIPVV